MTNKEAAKVLITKLYYTRAKGLAVCEDYADEFLDAICVAISALLKQEEKSECGCKSKKNVWHNIKKERPEEGRKCYVKSERDGLKYFWICKYTGGEWVPESNPEATIYDGLINYWAYYEDWDFEP